MTNKEAVSNLEHIYGIVSPDIQISLDLAIKALNRSIFNFKEGYKQAILDGKTGYSRPTGEWIDEGQYVEGHSEHAYICKNCGYQIIENPSMIFENRYCKYCGAKMKGEEE